jgi:hypothetical protein
MSAVEIQDSASIRRENVTTRGANRYEGKLPIDS